MTELTKKKKRRQLASCACCEKRCHYCGRFFDNRGYVTTYSQRGRLRRMALHKNTTLRRGF